MLKMTALYLLGDFLFFAGFFTVTFSCFNNLESLLKTDLAKEISSYFVIL